MIEYIKKNFNVEILFLVLGILFFIALRSLHFGDHFAFFYDQPLFSIKALEIWLNKSLVLIGPPTSLQVEGRYIFQGSIIYYMQLFFLLLANFDPLKATYLFMLFSSLMIIPLYIGIKMLVNKHVAILTTIIYITLPWYISATTSLWNPHFQFALMPILILFMGLYKKYKTSYLLLIIFIWAGILLQFHYQFILVIFALLIYYIFHSTNRIKTILISLVGLIIGFSPIIYFEFRNDFYNLRTIILFLTHTQELSKGSSALQSHYVLTISFFILILAISLFKKFLTSKVLIVGGLILCIWSILFINQPQTKGRPSNWTYNDELKVHNIIKNENIHNYNIYMFYDPTSIAQKYFLRREGILINYEDYYHNEYLFVVYNSENYLKNSAYEVNRFKPSTLQKSWKINNRYILYLLKRT